MLGISRSAFAQSIKGFHMFANVFERFFSVNRSAIGVLGLLFFVSVVSIVGCGQMFGGFNDDAGKGETVTSRLKSTHKPAPLVKASAESFQQDRRKAPSSRPIAMVNGQPIDRRDFLRRLIDARGLPLLQQMVLSEVARQESERMGLTVTQRDIDREYDITLQGARFNGKDIEALTPVRRAQLIEEWIKTRGIAREELAVAMERQAHLRKIAYGQIEVTEGMVRREYDRVHGEKVEVRHIQLAAKREYQQIMQRLAHGDRFEDLVADYSQNRLSQGNRGLLPPFTAADPTVPPIFVKVAFQMKPGEVSNPIEAEGSFHILKLERRIPSGNLSFNAAKQTLRKNLRARLVANKIDSLGSQLLRKTRIRIDDRVMRDQYRKRLAAGQIQGPPLVDR